MILIRGDRFGRDVVLTRAQRSRKHRLKWAWRFSMKLLSDQQDRARYQPTSFRTMRDYRRWP